MSNFINYIYEGEILVKSTLQKNTEHLSHNKKKI